MTEGAFLDIVEGFKNELAIEWNVNNIYPPVSVVQFYLKSGSGTVKSIFLDLALRLTAKWKPNSGE